jgi:endonuclease/exonuclease/phosphatase family metal-dependent hydrolase
VLNTHWDHVSKEANYYSAGLVRDKIAELSGGRPVIMMGDLNTQETEAAFLRLIGNEDPTGTQFTDTFRALYQTKKMTK